MSVSYGGDVITFSDNTTLGSAKTQWKNRIINGNMMVSQRANTTLQVGVASNIFLIDRFRLGGNGFTGGKVDVQKVTDGPTTEAGIIRNSLKITVNTAQSITSGDNILLSTMLEGQDIADFGMGTSAAKTITLSFYVKSSNTGTYAVEFGDDISAGYTSTYTITQANTWERKSVTIPGTTIGANWTTDNTFSARANWTLGAGSSVTGTPNQWNSTIAYQVAGCTNFISQAAGSTWQITGIQLELGSTATTFENRPYSTELQMCQRYYYQYSNAGLSDNVYFRSPYVSSPPNSSASVEMYFPVTMRSAPSVSSTMNSGSVNRQTSTTNFVVFQIASSSGSSAYAVTSYTASTEF